jgi:ELWxxDGT repeat protein
MISPTLGIEPHLFRNGTFTLLKDINPGAGDSNAAGYTPMGENVFFSADDGVHGNELWITDGTTAGTRMVKDILPEALGSYPQLESKVYNGKLFFFVQNSNVGTSLWASDGTESGTVLVKDLDTTTALASVNLPEYLVPFAGKLFFRADDGVNGEELWASDGTTAGTNLFMDILPGPTSSYPDYLVVSGEKLFFLADDGTHGAELWVSDGTAAGTSMVKDINLGATGMGMFNAMTAFNDKVYFQANDGTHGTELWVSDGTAAGTTLVKDINPGAGNSSPDYMTPYGGKLYFQANDGTHGTELWVSDGTAAGTTLVKDINPGAGNSSPDFFYVYGGKLHFLADDGIDGREPWVTDGTNAGTLLVADINPGAVGSNAVSLDFFKGLFLAPADLGGNYLVGDDGQHGFEIFLSDGLPGGTTSLVTDFNPGTPNGFLGREGED